MRLITNTFSWVVMTLVSAMFTSLSAYSDTQLNIRDSEGDAGDVIVLPEGAELDLAVDGDGITLTLPNVDLRLRCLGEPTADGYCLLEAGSGGGSGSDLLDSDGDGVPNANDLCYTTPANSFVNSSGCSSDQLGGGTTPQPTDSDNDGVADASDNCPNTANASQTDTDGDGVGDACDSTPNGDSGDDNTSLPGTSTYCSNSQSSRASCSRNENLDIWYVSSGESAYSVPKDKILALPFTTRDSNSDTLTLVYTTNVGPLQTSQYAWRTWVSQYPGGDRISSACYSGGSQARINFTITQNPSAGGCKLPTSKATWYVNYAVRGAAGYYPTNYVFDIQKSGSD